MVISKFYVRVAIVWILGLWLLAGTAMGADHMVSRKTLSGLGGVDVVVEVVPDEIAQGGLTSRLILSDTEEQLHGAGIKVFSRKGSPQAPGYPYIYIVMGGGKATETTYYFGLTVSLAQWVVLDRDPKISTFAETWSVSTAGVNAGIGDIRNSIKGLVGEFVKAHRLVN